MDRSRGINDYEPGPVPSESRVDRYGFIKQNVSNSSAAEGLGKSREARRVRKWRKMIGVGGSDWKHYVRRKPHVVKRRIRKGIPDCLRGLVWQLISGSRDLLLMNPGVYEVGLPLVQQYLFQFEHLVREHLPKLGEHFSREMINPSMYASQWFITVFSYSFPFPLALRIWDVFLFEGVKIVFKVGLALLKYCHDDLINLSFEKLIHALRNFPEDAMNPDILLPMAYSIKVSRSLAESKIEYEKQNRKPKIEA
uniref:Rab-GAP TBC domain-containing protein n=1 Tax=Gossypium raimondii TaxID=29730 RepID=A0A0D2P6P8_GOSRA|nr:hypothetical protein B456_004G045400 [Gossypium raimondii]